MEKGLPHTLAEDSLPALMTGCYRGTVLYRQEEREDPRDACRQ